MSLPIIRQELIQLCKDTQETSEIPHSMPHRIRVIRKKLFAKNIWTQKTEHLQIKALTALWEALSPSINTMELRWQVSVAEGTVEEAINIINDEWKKGVPKFLVDEIVPSDSVTREWIDDYLDDGGFISNDDLYDSYCNWMKQSQSEPITIVALGQKLSAAEFEKTSKKIEGKTYRGWLIKVKETSEPSLHL